MPLEAKQSANQATSPSVGWGRDATARVTDSLTYGWRRGPQGDSRPARPMVDAKVPRAWVTRQVVALEEGSACAAGRTRRTVDHESLGQGPAEDQRGVEGDADRQSRVGGARRCQCGSNWEPAVLAKAQGTGGRSIGCLDSEGAANHRGLQASFADLDSNSMPPMYRNMKL